MSIGVRTPSFSSTPAPEVPRLEPGDHLTRDEFERRYDATPRLKKAELIEGVVHMPPAVRADSHGGPHADLIGCLIHYRWTTPGVRVYDNTSIRLDLDNEPQPDAAMLVDPEFAGQARISADDYIEGAPELVAEISSSSVSIDLNKKLRVYRRNGVQEYIVWRVLERAIDWFVLRSGDFEPIKPQPDGIVRSTVFPGLWIDTAALVRTDLVGLQHGLQSGIQSAEYRSFVPTLLIVVGRRPHKMR